MSIRNLLPWLLLMLVMRAHAQQPSPGSTIKDCDFCPELVVVPAGSIPRNAGPALVLERTTAIGRYEVTRAEFDAYARTTRAYNGRRCYTRDLQGWSFRDGRNFRRPGFNQDDRHPAVCISWNEARGYVEWLSKSTGNRYRLLAVLELEYATYGGPTAIPSFSRDENPEITCEYANGPDASFADQYKESDYYNDSEFNPACDDGFVFTAPVGSYKANALGLHDMLGNVWEWTSECFDQDGVTYSKPDEGCYVHVAAGYSFEGPPIVSRTYYLTRNNGGVHFATIGFRVARELD